MCEKPHYEEISEKEIIEALEKIGERYREALNYLLEYKYRKVVELLKDAKRTIKIYNNELPIIKEIDEFLGESWVIDF